MGDEEQSAHLTCSELSQELGGDVLNKHVDSYVKELSGIDLKLRDSQRSKNNMAITMQNHVGEIQTKLSTMLEELDENEGALKQQIEQIKCENEKLYEYLKRIGKNNRKNNGKLCDAKVKLYRAQYQRELLTSLHKADDGELCEKYVVEQKLLEDLECQGKQMKKQVKKLVQECRDIVAETRASELEGKKESEILKKLKEEKERLEEPKCCLLKQVRDLLQTLMTAQPKLLFLECEQQMQSCQVSQLRAKLGRLQDDLSDKSSRYASLRSKCDQEQQSLDNQQKSNNQTEEEKERILNEIQKCTKQVNDYAGKVKCINRKTIEKQSSLKKKKIAKS